MHLNVASSFSVYIDGVEIVDGAYIADSSPAFSRRNSKMIFFQASRYDSPFAATEIPVQGLLCAKRLTVDQP